MRGCCYWLAQGWLVRRLPEGASEEEYELSRHAVQAIRFIAGIEHNASLATESRLAMVMQQISQLAQQTEADPEARLAALKAERDRIDAEIAQVSTGKVSALDGKRALERTRDVIRLADDLAEDFRRVRDDFEQLNRRFRERIMFPVPDKRGRVVALDKTSELLKAATGNVLVFKTDSPLPPEIAAQARVTGRVVQLATQDSHDIERHLAALREAGVDVQDIEIRRADLEDVFLRVMAAATAQDTP